MNSLLKLTLLLSALVAVIYLQITRENEVVSVVEVKQEEEGEIILEKEESSWSVSGVKIESLKKFVEDNYEAKFVIYGPDEMRVSELEKLFSLFDGAKKILTLTNSKGVRLFIDLNMYGKCLYSPEIEPMLIELSSKGARVNKNEFLSKEDLRDVLPGYSEMVKSCGATAVIQLAFDDLSYRELFVFMQEYKDFKFVMYVEDSIHSGGSEPRSGVEHLPRSPDEKKNGRFKIH